MHDPTWPMGMCVESPHLMLDTCMNAEYYCRQEVLAAEGETNATKISPLTPRGEARIRRIRGAMTHIQGRRAVEEMRRLSALPPQEVLLDEASLLLVPIPAFGGENNRGIKGEVGDLWHETPMHCFKPTRVGVWHCLKLTTSY